RKKSKPQEYLTKVGILLLADALMWLEPGKYIGGDFLGFIGISMLLLEFLRRCPSSLEAATGLGLLLILVRFGLGPSVRTSIGPRSSSSPLGFLIGINSMETFSYPVSPWLSYPLFGY